MGGYYDVRQTSDNRYLDERARDASQDGDERRGEKNKNGTSWNDGGDEQVFWKHFQAH